ncbi:hypothetical protein BD414DRAFT_143015 [Trametes punicea]|nr:hypothetical protein BD414DRAFT_143015 [Trametes punicea]
MSASDPSPVSLSIMERALKRSLLDPDFRDVQLYAFARRTVRPNGSVSIGHPLPILAIGSILRGTEYFSKLLSSGFAESLLTEETPHIRSQALLDEYDYESDSDLDEVEEGEFSDASGFPSEVASPTSGSSSETISSTKGKLEECELEVDKAAAAIQNYVVRAGGSTNSRQLRRILLPSVAHRTLNSCIFYLYTGKVNFLPLQSSSKPERRLSLLTAGDAAAPPCSPKSMFRLAELYCIAELQGYAYAAIIARLTPANIVQEAFSRFFASYDGLRGYAVSYLLQHYNDPRLQTPLQNALDKVLAGQLPHTGPLIRSLLGIRATAATPSIPPCTAREPMVAISPVSLASIAVKHEAPLPEYERDLTPKSKKPNGPSKKKGTTDGNK